MDANRPDPGLAHNAVCLARVSGVPDPLPKDSTTPKDFFVFVRVGSAGLRVEQRRLIASLVSTEEAIVKMERARGKLIDLDADKDLITRSILPLTIAIRRIPDSGRDDDEKARLQAISEALLAEIRRGADEAIGRLSVEKRGVKGSTQENEM